MARRRNWGSGSLVPPSTPGGSWGIRWNQGGRRRFRSGFTSRALAQRALDGIRGDIAREVAGLPPDAARLPTLAALAEEWLADRESTHRAAYSDRTRWTRDLLPTFGGLRCPDVDVATIRAWAVAARRRGLSGGSVRLGLALLSSLWTTLRENPRRTGAATDPTKGLPPTIRRKIAKSSHDPSATPYIRKAADIGRIYRAMSGAPSLAFAVGALAGLREGEIIALEWQDVDLERRQIAVRQAVYRGQLGPTKDGDPRHVPISDSLLPVLRAGSLAAGGRGLCCPPARLGRKSGPRLVPARWIRPQTLTAALDAALAECRLPRITFYQATRHTYASQYVLAGGSLSHLQALLGHSSPNVTVRYAHLAPQDLAAEDVSRITVDLGQRTGRVARHPSAEVAEKRSKIRG